MKIIGESAGQKSDGDVTKTKPVGIPRAGIAPNRRGSCLALGNSRLYQLGEAEIIVWDTSSFAVIARHPCPGPRGILALPDGSAVALGSSDQPGYTALLHILPENEKPQAYKVLTSCHPRDLSRLFVIDGAKRFAIASLNSQTAVDEFNMTDERGPVRQRRFELTHDAFFTLTPIGSAEWIYEHGVLTRKDEGGEHPLSAKQGMPHAVQLVKLDAASNLVATVADGSVVRFALTSGSVEAANIIPAHPKTPFLLDAAGAKIAVAFVSTDYQVEVMLVTASGREILRTQLPWRVSLVDADQHAMRVSDTRLVIGDRQRLAAWDLASGAQIYPRS